MQIGSLYLSGKVCVYACMYVEMCMSVYYMNVCVYVRMCVCTVSHLHIHDAHSTRDNDTKPMKIPYVCLTSEIHSKDQQIRIAKIIKSFSESCESV